MNRASDVAIFDEEGYLVDPEQWTEAVALKVAAKECLSLTDEHWQIIGFVRRWFADRQIIPDARFVIKYLAEELGYGTGARSRLFELFPYGYVKQTCKVAGMKRPRAWSTG